jgi:hypothetical protein
MFLMTIQGLGLPVRRHVVRAEGRIRLVSLFYRLLEVDLGGLLEVPGRRSDLDASFPEPFLGLERPGDQPGVVPDDLDLYRLEEVFEHVVDVLLCPVATVLFLPAG